MTLYLKYRPQTVSELDLTSARERISSLLSKAEIPHAFLFAGPRGTGKTSSARIVAKSINCEHKEKGSFEPCNKCETCLTITSGTNIDVVEMDAASNRGIDEIRALKQEIMLSPAVSKKKIYIIDEVHMLTTEAANAFLKTLEEPPAHVVFILATTDPQKLPQTVVSRLSVVPFERATVKEITNKLKIISSSEKFEVEDGVFEKIAKHADGSFRDAVKVLEELSQVSGKITNELIDSRFYTGDQNIQELKELIVKKDIEGQMSVIKGQLKAGTDEKAFLSSLIESLHIDLLKLVSSKESLKNEMSLEEVIRLLDLLLDAKSKSIYSPEKYLTLEIALVKFNKFLDHVVKTNVPEKTVQKKTEKVEESLGTAPAIKEKKTENVDIPARSQLNASTFDDTVWAKLLFDLRNKNAGVEALLRAAKPISFDGATFTIGVFFKFHKERLETAASMLVLGEVMSENFGTNVKVAYELTEPPKRVETVANVTNVSVTGSVGLTAEPAPDIINAAKEIFGN